MCDNKYCTKICEYANECICTLTQDEIDKLTSCPSSKKYDYMEKYKHSMEYWSDMHGVDYE